MSVLRKVASIVVGLLVFAAITGLLVLGVMGAAWLWRTFLSVSDEIQVALVTAAATVLAATCAVVLGRSFDRKREIDAHFREKKLAIYDEFLQFLFGLMHERGQNDVSGAEEVSQAHVDFLREWQRKLILWGGSSVIVVYIGWMRRFRSGAMDLSSVTTMDEMFRAIRKDLGLSNRGLEKGAFLHMILKDSDIFFAAHRADPSLSLEALSLLEEGANKEDASKR